MVFEVNYPGGAGNDSIQWRALVWAVAEGYFIAGILVNYLPPRLYSGVFKFSMMLYMVDFLLCVIWLPIGVSRTYGFRSAKEVFTGTCKCCRTLHCFGRLMALHRQPDGSAARMELYPVLVSAYIGVPCLHL